MKSLTPSSACLWAVLFVIGCQSSPLPTDVRPRDPIHASYQVREDLLWVTLVNTGQDDILVEIPPMGLEYSVEYEMHDGRIDELTNGRSVHLAESTLRLLKRCEDARRCSPQSTVSVEIPWKDSAKAIKRLKLMVRYTNISALHSVRTADALERLLIQNEQVCLARLAAPARGSRGQSQE